MLQNILCWNYFNFGKAFNTLSFEIQFLMLYRGGSSCKLKLEFQSLNLARLSLRRLNSGTETQARCAYIRNIFGLDWTHFFILSFYVVDGLINSGRKLVWVNTKKSTKYYDEEKYST